MRLRLVEHITEHADFLGEPLDRIVQGFAVAFARLLAWSHRRRMVPESEKPRKSLAAGAARSLQSPQEKATDRVKLGCRTSFIWPGVMMDRCMRARVLISQSGNKRTTLAREQSTHEAVDQCRSFTAKSTRASQKPDVGKQK